MRSSTRLVGAVAALVLLLGAEQEASAQLRGMRYCEVLPVYLVGGELVAEVWNTTGFNLCPQADFEALDPVAIAQDLGALTVILNAAAFPDILKWRRCSCDAPEFIELFYDTRGLPGLPIRGG